MSWSLCARAPSRVRGGHDIGELAFGERQVAFHGKAAGRAADGFQLGEQEISELRFQPDDEAEEQKVAFLFLALGYVPGPAGARQEELGVHHWFCLGFLRVQLWQSSAELIGQQLHGFNWPRTVSWPPRTSEAAASWL